MDAESPRTWHWHQGAEGDARQKEARVDPGIIIRPEALRVSLAWREVYAGVF
ncbi:MAG: hypothetical protein NZ585_14820 [Chloracidobacterium sp.]|nr:hypothetical protein [Chloracidobacterium sp.]MDW8217963.1 hypothetical protein [Acidobacteriota bacterium]